MVAPPRHPLADLGQRLAVAGAAGPFELVRLKLSDAVEQTRLLQGRQVIGLAHAVEQAQERGPPGRRATLPGSEQQVTVLASRQFRGRDRAAAVGRDCRYGEHRCTEVRRTARRIWRGILEEIGQATVRLASHVASAFPRSVSGSGRIRRLAGDSVPVGSARAAGSCTASVIISRRRPKRCSRRQRLLAHLRPMGGRGRSAGSNTMRVAISGVELDHLVLREPPRDASNCSRIDSSASRGRCSASKPAARMRSIISLAASLDAEPLDLELALGRLGRDPLEQAEVQERHPAVVEQQRVARAAGRRRTVVAVHAAEVEAEDHLADAVALGLRAARSPRAAPVDELHDDHVLAATES